MTISVVQLRLVQCAMVILLATIAVVGGGSNGLLSFDYYRHSCPDLESIVGSSLLPIFVADPRSPSAFLRLLFHDCQVQGCDASILLDSDEARGITSEMESGRNFGIRNRESISYIKLAVEAVCPGVVSCADILALAAREAVAYSGGPHIAIPLGRADSVTASNLRADANLPSPRLGAEGGLQVLMAKGMTIEESVAIIGAHTIGAGHCINVVHRLYNSQEKDSNIDLGFEAFLRLKCPTEVPFTNDTFIANDLTFVLFDNQYYRDVMNGRGLLTLDSTIATNARTAPIVSRFAEDQPSFFQAFSSAFVKLASEVGLASQNGKGEIRKQCDRVN